MKILFNKFGCIFLTTILLFISAQFIQAETLASISDKIEKSKDVISSQDLTSPLKEEIKKAFDQTSKEIDDYIEENAKGNDKIRFVYSEVAKAKNDLLLLREEAYKTLNKMQSNFTITNIRLGLNGLINRMDSVLKLNMDSMKKSPSESLTAQNKNAIKIIGSMAEAVKRSARNVHDNFERKLRSMGTQTQTN